MRRLPTTSIYFHSAARGNREVVDDQHVKASEAREGTRVGAIGARECELLEEAGRSSVDCTESLSTRLLGQRARDVTLAGPGRTGDQDGLVFLYPSAARELAHDGLVEFAPRRISPRAERPEVGVRDGLRMIQLR
jgi:hypothetical protein